VSSPRWRISLASAPSGLGRRDFWLGLEREERHHAESMHRLADIVAERPARFEPNRVLNVAAIQTRMAYVESLVQRLRAGEIPRADQYRLLTIACDLEQSVLEGKWNEIVKIADDEFHALIRTIVSDTIAHKAKIVGRLAATPKPL